MKGDSVKRMLVAGLALAFVCLASAPANAASARPSDPVQDYIDAAMLAEPGGVQVAPSIVEWGGGTAVLTVADTESLRAVGSCATGSICVYGSTRLTGAKLAFTTCSTFSTVGLGAAVQSMANARDSGYARGYNSVGGLLTTLAPTVSLNSAPVGVAKVSCSA